MRVMLIPILIGELELMEELEIEGWTEIIQTIV